MSFELYATITNNATDFDFDFTKYRYQFTVTIGPLPVLLEVVAKDGWSYVMWTANTYNPTNVYEGFSSNAHIVGSLLSQGVNRLRVVRAGDRIQITRELLWTPPNLKTNINGQLKEYADGWVKIDGQLRQIDKMWTKVNGILREV